MAKLAAVGENDCIMPFKAVGIEIHPVTTEEEFLQKVTGLIDEGVGVIFTSDKFSNALKPIFEKVSARPLPCIVPIPGPIGASEFVKKRMREIIRKACGVDIMGIKEIS